jgi:hypothetical protein
MGTFYLYNLEQKIRREKLEKSIKASTRRYKKWKEDINEAYFWKNNRVQTEIDPQKYYKAYSD